MDYSQLALFRMVAQRLDWLSQRQDVLAQNVANADTPGYHPNDLVPFERQLERAGRTGPAGSGRTGTAGSGRLAVQTTQPGHIEGRNGGRQELTTGEMRDVYEVAPSGNEVVLEQQLMALTETSMQHQTATGLYRKHLGMIRMALSRGR